MALRSGDGGTEWPNADGHPAAFDAGTSVSVRAALMLLERAEGAAREALVERLVQADMSGVLAEARVETARRGSREQP